MPTLLPVVAAAAALHAAARPHVVAMRAEEPPRLDGKLDDPVWASAPASSTFTEKVPDSGRAPPHATSVRVLYDEEAIYVGVDCEQRGVRIVRPLARRDKLVESDWVAVAIDSRRDRRTAFEFLVTAAGVKVDGIHFDDVAYSADWDDVWDARVDVRPDGWSAELRIPLRVLRYDELPDQSWGLQVRRHVAALQETDEWAFIPRAAAGEVSRYGRLDGLLHLPVRSPIAIRPFVLGRVRRRDPGVEAVASGVDASVSAGMDLEWHPTQNLTLEATLLPDFAQVEADQQVLNLTSFETYFPEKRPFFLSGMETFATPFSLVYTRRIGRIPARPAVRTGLPWGEQLADAPEPSRIWGAHKLVGRIGEGWTLGVLGAVVAPNEVDVVDASGARTRRLADPATAFHALRVRHDVAPRTQLGVLVTGATRAEPTAGYARAESDASRVLCPDGTTVRRGGRCFHDAWAGGADLVWRSPQGDWAASGQAVASLIAGGPTRTLRDGTPIGSGDVGGGGFLYFAKEGGEPWVGSVQWDRGGRRLDFDDVGYMVRQDYDNVHAAVEHRRLSGEGLARERHVRLDAFDVRNLDGLLLARGGSLGTSWVLRDFARVSLDVHAQAARWDDREIGDGAALERAALVGAKVGAASDPRKRTSGSVDATFERLANGWSLAASALLSVRPAPPFSFELVPQVVFATGEPRFVAGAPDPGEYLFGELSARSAGATLRASWTFTPRVSLQAYAQLFLAAGHYDAFRAFRGAPGSPPPPIALDRLAPAPPPAENPDFEQGSLNANVVWRWDYAPGSSLYVVWSRTQIPSSTVLPGEAARLDPGAVHRAPASDVLLAKITYWWG